MSDAPDRLFGHAAAERSLVESARSGRLHHAWLLAGPSGIGKATLARRFACWLLAGQPDDTMAVPSDHPVARRVAAGTHADLLTVGRGWDEKKQRHRSEIVVEDTRQVAEFLRRTAAEGGWRVVILDQAEAMNRNAANALLKILEEPPPRAVLMLVSSVPGQMLATIRSRCRLLRLEPLDDPALEVALSRLLPDLDAAERAALVRLAEGSPGRAIALAGDQAVALERLVAELMQRDPRGDAADPLRDAAIVETVLRQEQGFETFLGLLSSAISGHARRAARSGQAPRPGDPDWVAAWQGVRRLRDETERFNLEKRQALSSSLTLLSGSN